MATRSIAERRSRSGLNRLIRGPLPWLLPVFLMLLLFRLYPMVEAIRLSFTNASMIGDESRYVGLETFRRVIGDASFGEVLGNTAVFVGACIVLQLSLGLAVALLLARAVREELPGTMVFRGAVLTSWIIPGIVIGLIWKLIFLEGKFGIANYLLSQVGADPISFLSAPGPAMASIITANTWRGTAFSMIMQFAALQKIPSEYYEAATVDGANSFQKFLYVTVPQLRTILFINLVLITIYTFNLFDMILPLTGGGPGRATEVIALSLYNRAFSTFDLGGASALAVVMLGINLIMTIVYYFLLARDET